MILSNEEMLEVKGGSNTSLYLSLGLIGGAIFFFAGVLEGLLHPKAC